MFPNVSVLSLNSSLLFLFPAFFYLVCLLNHSRHSKSLLHTHIPVFRIPSLLVNDVPLIVSLPWLFRACLCVKLFLAFQFFVDHSFWTFQFPFYFFLHLIFLHSFLFLEFHGWWFAKFFFFFFGIISLCWSPFLVIPILSLH